MASTLSMKKKDGKKETHDNICIKNCQQIDRDRKNCGHEFAQKRKKKKNGEK